MSSLIIIRYKTPHVEVIDTCNIIISVSNIRLFETMPYLYYHISQFTKAGPFQGHHHSLKKEYTWCNRKPLSHISQFVVIFCENASPRCDLDNICQYHLLDHDLSYIFTKFHSNRPKNIKILAGGQCAPLGPGIDLKIN